MKSLLKELFPGNLKKEILVRAKVWRIIQEGEKIEEVSSSNN